MKTTLELEEDELKKDFRYSEYLEEFREYQMLKRQGKRPGDLDGCD